MYFAEKLKEKIFIKEYANIYEAVLMAQIIGMDESEYFVPKISVIGIGGAGCNTVNRLAVAGVKGAELIALNTDEKHLGIISPHIKKVLIGKTITRGLGAGGYPDIGKKAMEADRHTVDEITKNSNIVFLAAGMGGGTGTGGAPVVAEVARKQGAIVIAIVSYPFLLERIRLKKAEEGINELSKFADTVVVIDNNRLHEMVPNLPIDKAFAIADEVTVRAVQGITETIMMPSLINLDFADVRTIMTGGGVSLIAVGEAQGTNRAKMVVENTLKHRLLDVDYRGAKGVLLHVTGGPDLTLGEANEIGEMMTEAVDPNANVIWGARLDERFQNKLEAIAIFTGIKSPYVVGRKYGSAEAQEEKTDNIISSDNFITR